MSDGAPNGPDALVAGLRRARLRDLRARRFLWTGSPATRVSTATLAVFALLSIASAPAPAQAPPCGDALESLTTYAPRAVRAGTLFAVESDHDGVSKVESTEVLFADQTIPFTQDEGDSTRVVVPAPAALGLYPLTISWFQPEEGTSCSGSDQHDIRVVPARSRIGDTDYGRVDGRWAMSFFPANFHGQVDRVRWVWRPRCDVGACGARVRSSSGNRLRFGFDGGDLTAHGRDPEHFGWCEITRSIGDVVLSRRRFEPAYRGRFEHELEIRGVAERGGLLEARTIRGVNRFFAEPFGAARRAGCDTQVSRWRVYGRRL